MRNDTLGAEVRPAAAVSLNVVARSGEIDLPLLVAPAKSPALSSTTLAATYCASLRVS